ncbi:MAG: ATP-binding protein [Leptospiraceae bacterium]|nr:ATP-binding protein [Leptospiraceae bacterium]
METRRLQAPIRQDLQNKIVILSGPRQCGKTTIARKIASFSESRYYNWDNQKDRLIIQNNEIDLNTKILLFDELHKFRRWRGFLKGLYDQLKEPDHLEPQILVTGSGRLEAYSHGGDSLQGRYFGHRLHPFTLSELSGLPFQNTAGLENIFDLPLGKKDHLDALFQFSGFPEPLLAGSNRNANRWRNAYSERLVQEDVRSLENIKELEKMELLYDRLSDCAGSVLSINSLREDLEVAFETVRNYILIFEKLYAIFRIPPFGPARIKAVKKEQKLYFFDWARAGSDGSRIENMIALHLLRFVHWMHDVEGEKWDLRYFRNRDGHEVDFVLLKNRKPWAAIECKLGDANLSPSLKYLLERVEFPHAFQVVHDLPLEKEKSIAGFGKAKKIHIVSSRRFLSALA